MKSHILITTLMLLMICPSTALSSDFPDYPKSQLFNDQSGERNAIHMDCNPNFNDMSLDCSFFQMSVSYEQEPSKLEQAILSEIAAIFEDDEYSEENFRKEITPMCNELKKTKVQKAIADLQPGLEKDFAVKTQVLFKRMCEANNGELAKKEMEEMIIMTKQRESVTCKVWPNVWEEKFVYQVEADSQYWLSQSEPNALCEVINISTLKKKDKFYWDYESRRIVTDMGGEIGTLFSCSDFVDRTIKYSREGRPHEVMCREIKFSPMLSFDTRSLERVMKRIK